MSDDSPPQRHPPPTHLLGAVEHGGHQHNMGMHAMAFHFGVSEKILFDFWTTNSAFGLIVSCIVIVIGCYTLEFARWFRLFRRKQRIAAGDELDDNRYSTSFVLTDALFHAFQLTMGYLMMLIFMTFNIWLCLAVIVGEVTARSVFTIMLPSLDRLNSDTFATSDTCCG